MNDKTPTSRKTARLRTPTSLGSDATRDISGALNALLADFFALYLKTRTFTGMCRGPIFATITCFWTSRPTNSLPRPT